MLGFRGLRRGLRDRFLSALVAGALIPALALGRPEAATDENAAREIRPGEPIEGRLAGGAAQAFRVGVRPGARLLVTVEQRGIDLVVEARAAAASDLEPRDEPLVSIDSPLDSEGPETLLLPVEIAGPVEIRVLSPSRGAAPGSFVITLEEIRSDDEAVARRLEGLRLLTEAGAANRIDAADERRKAAALYERAEAIYRSLGRGSDEARCALARGGIALGLGEAKEAVDRYGDALERFTRLGDEGGEAAAWGGLGLARVASGDPAAGAEAQRSALDLERRLGRTIEEAKALNNLGFALHSSGRLREGLDFYRRALDRFVEAGETGSWKANVLHNLAAVAHGLGEPEAALAADREVLALWRALGDRRGEARTLTNLGALENDLGEFGQALEAYTPALAIFEASGDRLWQASVLRNRGAAYYGLGDYLHARADFEAAMGIRREVGDVSGAAAAEIAAGYARLRAGEVTAALELGRRAGAAAEARGDKRGELLARLLAGKASLDAGDEKGALGEASRALARARDLESRIDEAAALQILGQAQLALGPPGAAARTFEEALGISRAIESPARTLEALVGLARVARTLGQPQEARKRTDEALRTIETLRASESDPDLRASFLAAQRAAFELAIDLAMAAHDPLAGFEVAERARARSLLDLLNEARTDVREGIDPTLRERERALLLRLHAKAGRRAELAGRPAGDERRRAVEVELRSTLDELAALDSEIRDKSPRYAALTRPQPVTAAEARALLAGDDLLLEVSLGEERSYLWALEAEGISGFELPPRAEIEAAARAVYLDASALREGVGAQDARKETAAARLSSMLFGPIAARLGERRLIVALDGQLAYVPVAALPIPGVEERGRPIPLVVRHEVVEALSASSVALARRFARKERAKGAVAVLADPVFDPLDSRVRTAPSAAASDAGRRGPFEGKALARLPWTRREAEAIEAIAPRDRAFVALDFRASRATALSSEIASYRIVHFATHGLIDAATPALSGLMLSRVDPSGRAEEGFLGLRDVYNLRLGADLVVLSGCETALGVEVRGEGLIGLSRGFLYAGARQVLASLWRVEDRATAELMARFYRGLLTENLPPAAALRRAQLSIRAEPRWRSPYYWSGFVLEGDWAAP